MRGRIDPRRAGNTGWRPALAAAIFRAAHASPGPCGERLLCRWRSMILQSERTKKLLRAVLHAAPLLIVLGLFLSLLRSGDRITAQTILSYSPEQPALAALFLIALFALKSLSVLLPLAVLFMAGGILFPTPVAIAVSTAGVAVAITIPYLLGRHAGADRAAQLAERYPKVRTLQEFQRRNDFLFSFMTRIIGILPCDIVSLYMGASGVPYGKYLAGGLLGLLPDVIAITVLGTSISDPRSPAFLVSCCCVLAIIVISLLFYNRYRKKT